MKCQVCNVESPTGAAFCPQCGAKLPAGNTGAAASADPAAAAGNPAAGAAYPGRRRGTDVPEETLWEGSYAPKAMIGSFLGAGAASIALVVVAILFSEHGAITMLALGAIVAIWLVIAARLLAKRLGIHYRLTNQMFYHQKGVITRITNRVEAIDIHDVEYEQNLLERLVNVGRIKISSSDRTHPELIVEGVENVQEVAQMIDKARRAERIRRGVSVEAI